MDASSDFVGRAAELDVLEAEWRGARGAFVPIYGRRRVGKSELVLRFMKGRPGLYHVGKVAPAELQLREFLDEAATLLGEPLLRELPAGNWKRALEEVVRRFNGKKLILAFDEFQWTAEASPELPSVLQELWDRDWKKSGKVMLLLCGSFVGFMEREVLGKKSPLYGRRTAQMHLLPLGYGEAAQFHRGWSIEHRAAAYFICGGVPQYLRAFEPGRSLRHNVEATLLSEFAPLFREPEFLLREELREVESYHAVLTAIAGGQSATRDIARVAGLPERSLPYYLEQLVQLGYVGRRHPCTGGRVVPRHVRFFLEDPLLRFWFRFVFPHQSFVLQHGPARAWTEVVAPGLDAYFGGCFERLCREALPRLLARESVSTRMQVGEYWDRAVQIDVVGVRDDGVVELGECKWGRVQSAPALVAELEQKVAAFPNPRKQTVSRRLFVREKPAAAAKAGAARWHDLADLYRAWG